MTSETFHPLEGLKEQKTVEDLKPGTSEDKISYGMSRRKFLKDSFTLVGASGLYVQHKLLGSSVDGSDSEGFYGPKLNIIDTHTHFYDPSRSVPEGRDKPVPWPSPEVEDLYKPTLPADWEAIANPPGITGTVVVDSGTD